MNKSAQKRSISIHESPNRAVRDAVNSQTLSLALEFHPLPHPLALVRTSPGAKMASQQSCLLQ